jgi:ATP-dependent RNA helicase DHX8/PRP22
MPLDDEPQVDKIYRGTVNTMRDFGAFIQLDGVRGRREGLLHISAIPSITGSRLGHPSEVLTKSQRVYVKVQNVQDKRISLAMRDIDQTSGRDFSGDAVIRTSNYMVDPSTYLVLLC